MTRGRGFARIEQSSRAVEGLQGFQHGGGWYTVRRLRPYDDQLGAHFLEQTPPQIAVGRSTEVVQRQARIGLEQLHQAIEFAANQLRADRIVCVGSPGGGHPLGGFAHVA